MLRSQDSFHELEHILRSLQEHSEPANKTISSDHAGSLNGEEGERKELKKVQEIPVLKVEFCDELSIEDILMEILLHQQLHTSKEYTLNGLRFTVYVLDDTEVWTSYDIPSKARLGKRLDRMRYLE